MVLLRRQTSRSSLPLQLEKNKEHKKTDNEKMSKRFSVTERFGHFFSSSPSNIAYARYDMLILSIYMLAYTNLLKFIIIF